MPAKEYDRDRELDKQQFVPGLILNEGFFHDLIKPIIDRHFPSLQYDAAITGHGSDALGFDTSISMDHYWGPRAMLFLSKDDYQSVASNLKKVISTNLPDMYKGFPTNWNFDRPDSGARPEYSPKTPLNPYITIQTVSQFVKDELSIDFPCNVSTRDWLTFPEQELLHLSSGRIFHQSLGELVTVRNFFNYYHQDIWLYKMRTLWSAIVEEQAFVGRCHDVQDELGERIIATRITNKLMKLCFYLEKTYYPYSKWFGTGFSKLKCAEELSPVFRDILSAPTYKERENALCAAYVSVVEKHNQLKITEPLPLEVIDYYHRGYRGYETNQVVEALTQAISPDFWREVGVEKLESDIGRIPEIEPLLDDSNYVRNSKILRQLIMN
jgi:hypothetical protein